MVDMTDMYVRIYIYIYYIYISIHFLNEQILHIYDIHRCMYVCICKLNNNSNNLYIDCIHVSMYLRIDV